MQANVYPLTALFRINLFSGNAAKFLQIFFGKINIQFRPERQMVGHLPRSPLLCEISFALVVAYGAVFFSQKFQSVIQLT